jgi:hypothetical protein
VGTTSRLVPSQRIRLVAIRSLQQTPEPPARSFYLVLEVEIQNEFLGNKSQYSFHHVCEQF